MRFNLQFRGNLRSPGDRTPGMPVVLVVDEYHLDIRADGELISRYYLADVEVARDIAERFILFLGDDEMEFLAEDALQFAYDGVAAMQEAWLAAQKRKRKHKKAAAQSARRKDEELSESPVPSPIARVQAESLVQRTRPAPPKKPDAPPSELAKRIAAATRAEEAARQAASEPLPELELLARNAVPNTYQPETHQPEAHQPEPLPPEPSPEPLPQPVPVLSEPLPVISVTSNGSQHDSLDLGETDDLADETLDPDPEAEAPVAKRPRAPSKSRPVVIPTVAFTSERLEPITSRALEEETGDDEESVRFAAAGHHPAETNVGLLSRLRRQPKVPDDHTHKFRESGSGVGLVRRVCTECSYVSIGSGD